jgi:hypothetical protein
LTTIFISVSPSPSSTCPSSKGATAPDTHFFYTTVVSVADGPSEVHLDPKIRPRPNHAPPRGMLGRGACARASHRRYDAAGCGRARLCRAPRPHDGEAHRGCAASDGGGRDVHRARRLDAPERWFEARARWARARRPRRPCRCPGGRLPRGCRRSGVASARPREGRKR